MGAIRDKKNSPRNDLNRDKRKKNKTKKKEEQRKNPKRKEEANFAGRGTRGKVSLAKLVLAFVKKSSLASTRSDEYFFLLSYAK